MWLTSFQIFTGIFPRHYDPPDGFTFEINDVSQPIQVDFFYFVKKLSEEYISYSISPCSKIHVKLY
jgi:alpha-mannosidase